MSFQLLEHWNTMTNEEIYKETLIIFILMIILVLIAYISDNLKKKYEDKLFLRFIASTLVGEGLDAIIFIFIGFLGTMPLEALLLMIVAQALFKTIYEIIIYPLTRYVIGYVKRLPEV